jgi:hypothetical protein
MMSTSTQRNDVLVADNTSSTPWAAEAQAKIAALYHQIEGHDPNDAAMVLWTQQLIAGMLAI